MNAIKKIISLFPKEQKNQTSNQKLSVKRNTDDSSGLNSDSKNFKSINLSNQKRTQQDRSNTKDGQIRNSTSVKKDVFRKFHIGPLTIEKNQEPVESEKTPKLHFAQTPKKGITIISRRNLRVIDQKSSDKRNNWNSSKDVTKQTLNGFKRLIPSVVERSTTSGEASTKALYLKKETDSNRINMFNKKFDNQNSQRSTDKLGKLGNGEKSTSNLKLTKVLSNLNQKEPLFLNKWRLNSKNKEVKKKGCANQYETK